MNRETFSCSGKAAKTHCNVLLSRYKDIINVYFCYAEYFISTVILYIVTHYLFTSLPLWVSTRNVQ